MAKLPGVTDYILERKKFDEVCVQHKEISNLSWIPGGTPVPNPLELLTQSGFQQLLNEGLAHFDCIVIDTVPLLPVSDALYLVDKVQTVVLVVQGGKTPRKAVQRSRQLLNKANARIEGIVLNLLPRRLFKGYYYYPTHK
jgi:capsular exopolysaccharide synthesis family protein